jgi:ankyrin repeat protein
MTGKRWAMIGIFALAGLAIQCNPGPPDNLFDAVKSGEIKRVERLLARGLTIDARDPGGMTPFSLAIREGLWGISELLWHHGADVNARDWAKNTPLHYAAGAGNSHAVALLLNWDASVGIPGHMGETPLSYAAANGNIRIAQMLLSRGALVTSTGKMGRTPLHAALESGSPEMIQLLVEAGADIDAGDRLRLTPLHWAAEKSDIENVKVLLELGADPNRKAHDGRTALDVSWGKGCDDIVDLLRPITADTAHLAWVKKGKDASKGTHIFLMGNRGAVHGSGARTGLREAARKSGGGYFEATSPAEMESLYHVITPAVESPLIITQQDCLGPDTVTIRVEKNLSRLDISLSLSAWSPEGIAREKRDRRERGRYVLQDPRGLPTSPAYEGKLVTQWQRGDPQPGDWKLIADDCVACEYSVVAHGK